MYARAAAASALLLLLLSSCTIGAEEAPGFPTYLQGTRELPAEITVAPVFSQAGNYGLVAAGDTLYHLELRHGRIHGRTGFPETVTGLAAGAGEDIFVSSGSTISLVRDFQTILSAEMDSDILFLTCCGSIPAVHLTDGRVLLLEPSDLSVDVSSETAISSVTAFCGFNSVLCIGGADGSMESLAVPSLDLRAAETVNGPVQFMTGAGDENLLFSSEQWNEVAACSPVDLRVHTMFTFPVTPVHASSDSSLSFVFAVCPGSGVQVCSASGEIQWRGAGYGGDAMVDLADDLETALITTGNRVDILVR